MSAWLHNVPELSLLTLLSFHCLLRPVEARQLRWCNVKIVDGSLSTRYENILGIAHIREPRTRRMAGHAAQQQVLLECLGMCQLVNTMKSSIPSHILTTAIWKFTAAQHFALFRATTPQPWRVTSTFYAPWTPMRWSYHHWLQYRDLPHLRRRGPWTSERTLASYIQEETFPLHQTGSHVVSLQKKRLRRVPRQATTVTTFPEHPISLIILFCHCWSEDTSSSSA